MKLKEKILLSIIGLFVLTIIFSCCFNINYATESSKIYDYTQLDENRYPGIKNLIQNLKNTYKDKFNFQIYETGIDWNNALMMEYQGHYNSPKNLIEKTSTRAGMWFCSICTDSKYDNNYNCASIESLAYMMDPRNSLDIASVFQFKTLSVSDVTSDDIARVVSGTFLNNPSVINAITQASNSSSVNGYYIVSKIINEQGKAGSTLSLGQGYNGNYVGYYNLFNIGAFGNGKDAIINNGLKFAKEQNWNSPEASILGGIDMLKNYYIGRQQDTLYFQKFNVVSESGNIFNHQYQQNIMAAEMEGRTLKNYYIQNGGITGTHTFVIPVYENMPKSASPRPSAEGKNTVSYEVAKVSVGSNNTLTVYSKNSDPKIAITSLNNGESVKVLNRAKEPINGIYWDLIISDKTGSYGYVTRNSSSGEEYLKLTGESGVTGTEGISILNFVFDANYYANKYPDLKSAFGNDIVALKKHWLDCGIKEGRQASCIFDPIFYVESNQDIKNTFGNNYLLAYEHFINNGYLELRTSSSEYCGLDYKNNYKDLANMSAINLIQHYCLFGKNEGRIAKGEIPIILSGVEAYLFDRDYYLNKYSDLKKAFSNASDNTVKKHWLESGIKEGRVASPILDLEYYLGNYKDLAKAYGKDYLAAYNHFVNIGYKEMRASSSTYCGERYKALNSDLRNMSALELIQHYMTFGRYEKRIANDKPDLRPIDITSYLFDAKIYASLNSDVYLAFGNNESLLKKHWLEFGIKEGRIASLVFDAKYYLNKYSDLRNVFGVNYLAAYNHFIQIGCLEGRKASEFFDVIYYSNKYSDLSSLYSTSYTLYIKHFVEFGYKEGRIGSDNFKINVYNEKNSDLNNAFGTNWIEYYIHYVQFGKNENRIAY